MRVEDAGRNLDFKVLFSRCLSGFTPDYQQVKANFNVGNSQASISVSMSKRCTLHCFWKHKRWGVKVNNLESTEASPGKTAMKTSRQQLETQIIPVCRNCYCNNLLNSRILQKNQRFKKIIYIYVLKAAKETISQGFKHLLWFLYQRVGGKNFGEGVQHHMPSLSCREKKLNTAKN